MATDIYVSITNSDGEVLTEGACSDESIGAFQKVDHEDEAYVLALDHKFSLPTDIRSGQVTGAPKHEHFKFTKFVDRSSPLLAGTLVNPAELEVEVSFYRHGDGGMEHFYSITLGGAHIVSIQTISPNILDPDSDRYVAYEEVVLTYGRIDWEHEICSTSASDDATGR